MSCSGICGIWLTLVHVTAAPPLRTDDDEVAIYQQPTRGIDVAARVFVNPKPWPRKGLVHHTASVMWQHLELEATPSAGAGLSVRGITISHVVSS